MYGLDGEEIYYFNFITNKTAIALPEFVDSELFGFSKYFETVFILPKCAKNT